ncbi:hypothetical protein FDP41_003854 [Naegleria fowleri]|uniref:WH2 domain-containing protein n=1 Tax=Naegleria fowleri TaxID=5763 RepID=A0A6A5BSA8_NAEFO|nr:uncharacterized protein FDP41_003854 [Naegleria fowleri]KAF0977201.1 hypothetical protein FDP41_003854 [Naegleria fowleri]CAG4719512.1 unnamed protein product [Naegleria fowleri]
MSLITSYFLENSQALGKRLYGDDVFEKVRKSLLEKDHQPSTTDINSQTHSSSACSSNGSVVSSCTTTTIKQHNNDAPSTNESHQASGSNSSVATSSNFSITSSASSKNASLKALTTSDIAHQNNRNEKVKLDIQTTNQCLYLTTLLGMLSNLRKLSIASQVAIANITSLTDQTFKRVCAVHDKYQELRSKLEGIDFDHVLPNDQEKPSHENYSVRNQEPDQGRFNPSTMTDGWYEQYLRCPDNPNFKPIEDLILKPGYAHASISQNYSHPEGIYASWKENYVRQMKNETKNHNKARSLGSSRKSLQVGDVIVPEKKVKKIKKAWKHLDKNNGLKQLVQKREGSCSSSTQLSESQKIVITGCHNIAPAKKTKIHSVMRSASQKTLLTTTTVSSPPKAEVRRKPLPSIPKSRSGARIDSNESPLSELSNLKTSPSQELSQPPSERIVNVLSVLSQQDSHTNVPSNAAVIPPPPMIPQHQIPPPPSMSSIQPVVTINSLSIPPPPLTSITLASNALGTKISELAGVSNKSSASSHQKQAVSPRDQTVRNDTMADLLESIRKGIKLSKATERVIPQKPLPGKEAFDVFSVLKEKFKFARGGESCDESFRNYGDSTNEDW